jgi:hypothetical protein
MKSKQNNGRIGVCRVNGSHDGSLTARINRLTGGCIPSLSPFLVGRR